ncbi:MAG: hypothetical protein WDN06_09420 [Asticcacaulis sp.]
MARGWRRATARDSPSLPSAAGWRLLEKNTCTGSHQFDGMAVFVEQVNRPADRIGAEIEREPVFIRHDFSPVLHSTLTRIFVRVQVVAS